MTVNELCDRLKFNDSLTLTKMLSIDKVLNELTDNALQRLPRSLMDQAEYKKHDQGIFYEDGTFSVKIRFTLHDIVSKLSMTELATASQSIHTLKFHNLSDDIWRLIFI
jgi:hypothetical protein